MFRLSPIPEWRETEEAHSNPTPSSQQIEVPPRSKSTDDYWRPPSPPGPPPETEDKDWLSDKLDSPFFKKYVLLLDQKVPQGGHSRCFKCREKKTGLPFFVKIVTADRMAKTEVNLLTLCKGMEGVVEMFEAIHHNNYVYIIMEDLTGGEALNRLTDDFYSDEEKARVLMQKICKGVKNLHRFGIIHGDLKLENLVFVNESEDSEVKVIDLGGACFSPQPGDKGKVHATIPYCAPEIFGNVDVITTKSDMWSMGVILFIILTGVFPFADEDCVAMRLNVQGCYIDRTTEEWHKLSVGAQGLVLGLLEVDPQQRLNIEELESHRWMHETDSSVSSFLNSSTEGEDESSDGDAAEQPKPKRQRLCSDEERDSQRG